jgi:hypothetical protein
MARQIRQLAGLTLAAFLISGLSIAATDPAPLSGPSVDYVGTYVWSMDDETFGGFSGIEISDDGSGFTVLSDRSELRWGQIERDADGAIDGLKPSGKAHLFDSGGKWLQPGWKGDSEGLAIDAAGTLWVSFEGLSRVVRYDTPESLAKPLSRPPEFKSMQRNSSFEALAVMADGTLLTLPERSGQLTRPFPVWRWRNGTWDQPFSIQRSGDWLAVGADVGPDGRFYLLERDFKGLLGFRSRVRRFEIGENGLSDEAVLLESYPLQYDNLEGISVWQDAQGIRLTLISDDNFGLLQRTELVEYRVTE